MAEFELSKNVPAPGRRGGAGNAKFPLREMEIGHSFHMPFGSNPMNERSVLSNALAAFKLRNPGWDYTTRKDDTGVRVWRTA